MGAASAPRLIESAVISMGVAAPRMRLGQSGGLLHGHTRAGLGGAPLHAHGARRLHIGSCVGSTQLGPGMAGARWTVDACSVLAC